MMNRLWMRGRWGPRALSRAWTSSGPRRAAPAPLHVCVFAGEASGDAIGAALMRSLRRAAAGEGDGGDAKASLEESGAFAHHGVVFSGVGGPEMAEAGLSEADSLFPMADLSVMGLTEVVPSLPRLYARAKTASEHIARAQPDVVVTIDAKGFNLRMLRRARELLRESHRPPIGGDGPEIAGVPKDIKFVHYVAPSVWAYKDRNFKSLFVDSDAALIDHLLVLLPFEEEIFNEAGIPTTFVGYPSVEHFADAATSSYNSSTRASDSLHSTAVGGDHLKSCGGTELEHLRSAISPSGTMLREKLGYSEHDHVMLLLPGSRLQEVKRHAPILYEALRAQRRELPDTKGVLRPVFLESPDKISAAWLRDYLTCRGKKEEEEEEVETPHATLPSSSIDADADLHSSLSLRFAAMSMADSAVSASGTAVVELALSGCPTLCMYKTSWLTGKIAQRLADVSSVSLPNILCEKTAHARDPAEAKLIPELLFEECNVDSVTCGMENLISLCSSDSNGAHSVAMDEILDTMVQRQGGNGIGPMLRPSAVAAREILRLAGRKTRNMDSGANESRIDSDNIVIFANRSKAEVPTNHRLQYGNCQSDLGRNQLQQHQLRAFSSLRRGSSGNTKGGGGILFWAAAAAIAVPLIVFGLATSYIVLVSALVIGGLRYLAKRIMGGGGAQYGGKLGNESQNSNADTRTDDLLEKLRDMTRLSRSFQTYYSGCMVDSLISTQVNRSPGRRDTLTMSFSVVDSRGQPVATLFAIGYGEAQNQGIGGGSIFQNLMAVQGAMDVLSMVYVVDARTSRRLDISVHDGTIHHSANTTGRGGGSDAGRGAKGGRRKSVVDIQDFQEK